MLVGRDVYSFSRVSVTAMWKLYIYTHIYIYIYKRVYFCRVENNYIIYNVEIEILY